MTDAELAKKQEIEEFLSKIYKKDVRLDNVEQNKTAGLSLR